MWRQIESIKAQILISQHFQGQIQSTLFVSIYAGASEKKMQISILSLYLFLVTWALDPWGFCWDFPHCDILVFGSVLLFSKDKSDTDLQS